MAARSGLNKVSTTENKPVSAKKGQEIPSRNGRRNTGTDLGEIDKGEYSTRIRRREKGYRVVEEGKTQKDDLEDQGLPLSGTNLEGKRFSLSGR